MKFNTNNRSSYRADYEQFSKFLKGSQLERNDNLSTQDNCDAHSNCNTSSICGPHDRGESSFDGNHREHFCHKGHRPIAMVYCEEQEWDKLFDMEIGLTKGTVFEELDLPLLATSCGKGGCMGC